MKRDDATERGPERLTLDELAADLAATDQGGAHALGEAGDIRALLERFRLLTVEPSGRLPLALRHAVRRRQALRRPRRGLEPRMWLQLAMAAAITVFGLLLERRLQRAELPEPAPQVAELQRTDAAQPRTEVGPTGRPQIPVQTEGAAQTPDWATLPAEAAESLRQLVEVFPRSRAALEALPEDQLFAQVASADRRLALLRTEFRQRHSPQARRKTIALAGGDPSIEERIQELAGVVAERAVQRIDAGVADPFEVGQALRALLAAGSTDQLGPHASEVRSLGAWLAARVSEPALTGGERIIAASALADLAVAAGEEYATLVSRATEALALATLRPAGGGGRPDLLHWNTPGAMLGEAGRLFALAPAFGVHAALAQRARMLVHEHLQERLERRSVERPDLIAALRYGFADLHDVAELDRQLLLWRPPQLAELPDGYTTMHHLAWSLYPIRPGWAEFQLELRRIAALTTPRPLGDAAALLLSLTTSFAAPGVAEMLAIAGR